MHSSDAHVVAIAMQKGGVGKTTTTAHLARAAALKGLKTLVVDLDQQGNTTGLLAQESFGANDVGVADAIVPDAEFGLDEVVVPSVWPEVSLAPAVTRPMVNAENILRDHPDGREYFLDQALQPLRGAYDLILMDCPPALSVVTVNGLVAADCLLAIAQGDGFSADALAELRRTVREIREYHNPDLRWAGILVNLWRNTMSEQLWIKDIQDHFSDAEVWPERIPNWSGVKESLDEGRGLDQGRQRFRELAERYSAMVDRLLATRLAVAP